MDKDETDQIAIKDDQPPPETHRSNWQIVKSVIAGLFGIQSEINRKADFKEGKASDYIIYGIIGVVTLIALMIMLVQQVIK